MMSNEKCDFEEKRGFWRTLALAIQLSFGPPGPAVQPFTEGEREKLRERVRS